MTAIASSVPVTSSFSERAVASLTELRHASSQPRTFDFCSTAKRNAQSQSLQRHQRKDLCKVRLTGGVTAHKAFSCAD